LENPNSFEPKASKAQILTWSPSQSKPAMLDLFGLSQLGTLCKKTFQGKEITVKVKNSAYGRHQLSQPMWILDQIRGVASICNYLSLTALN
jgi:hypothetical protein